MEDGLITFGGPCPRCFADIPGEEAATDPGEEVKARQASQDRRRATFRALIPVALAMPLVLCLGIAALWYGLLKPAPTVATLDFDALDFPMPEIVSVTRPAPPKAAAGGQPKTRLQDQVADRGGPRLAAQDGGADDGIERRPGGITAPAAPDISDGAASGSSQQSGLNFGVGLSASRRGGKLTDRDAIMKMIGVRMTEQLPSLNRCYERQLKVDEALRGRWRIAYQVTDKGRVKDAGATGIEQRNREFEACVAREISRWSFQPIQDPTNVQKTLLFRPG